MKNDYNYFQNTLSEVLNKHAPLKKEILESKWFPVMTKNLKGDHEPVPK